MHTAGMSAVETMPEATFVEANERVIPPLENGARLSRPEFHRRYENSPRLRKAELVEGTVYIISSPVSLSHSASHGILGTLLGTYALHTSGVQVGNNGTLLLDNENEPQPDLMLRLVESAAGARSRASANGYVTGPPEMVVEIAVSSASLDLRDKFRAYQRNGIQEYLVWRVQENRLDWWQLIDGEYQAMAPDAAGVIESGVFPGLRLAVKALLAGAQAEAFAELQAGIASEAHRAFAASLNP